MYLQFYIKNLTVGTDLAEVVAKCIASKMKLDQNYLSYQSTAHTAPGHIWAHMKTAD